MALSNTLAALLCGALLLTACGDVEVTDLGKLEKPAQHDAAAQTVQTPAPPLERKVVVPEEVAKMFSGVKLTMKRSADAQQKTFTQKLGETRTVEGVTLTVRDYLPAFFMDNDSYTSQGSEESNAAVWVEAHAGETLLFRGWLFRDYPELNPPVEPSFEIRLVEAVKATR